MSNNSIGFRRAFIINCTYFAIILAIVFVLTMTLCTTLFLRWRKREEDKL